MTVAPSSWVEAVVDEVVPRTPRINSVFLHAPIRDYAAGQHVDVRLTAPDGYQAQRSYSIASAPGADRIELAIERLEDGEVSPYFSEVARAGDTFEMRGPIGGHFVWPSDNGGPLLLVAGGSGIAPIMSIARHRAIISPDTPATLLYSARTWEDLAYREELMAMEQHSPGFRLIASTTRGPRQRSLDFERRLDRALIQETIARGGAPHVVYVCGSTAFVATVTAALLDEGIAAARIRTERFGGLPTTAPGVKDA